MELEDRIDQVLGASACKPHASAAVVGPDVAIVGVDVDACRGAPLAVVGQTGPGLDDFRSRVGEVAGHRPDLLLRSGRWGLRQAPHRLRMRKTRPTSRPESTRTAVKRMCFLMAFLPVGGRPWRNLRCTQVRRCSCQLPCWPARDRKSSRPWRVRHALSFRLLRLIVLLPARTPSTKGVEPTMTLSLFRETTVRKVLLLVLAGVLSLGACRDSAFPGRVPTIALDSAGVQGVTSDPLKLGYVLHAERGSGLFRWGRSRAMRRTCSTRFAPSPGCQKEPSQ